jgi:hypothetical protein
MIIGVTDDQDGRVVQRLSVSTKVSIGLPPNGDRNHPTKLDQFVFLCKRKSANLVDWEADPELTKHYGEQCRELHIRLIDDDIENVFPSSYAWWTATERKCWGDGVTATRRTVEKPGGQPRTTCGSGCPELANGQCFLPTTIVTGRREVRGSTSFATSSSQRDGVLLHQYTHRRIPPRNDEPGQNHKETSCCGGRRKARAARIPSDRAPHTLAFRGHKIEQFMRS